MDKREKEWGLISCAVPAPAYTSLPDGKGRNGLCRLSDLLLTRNVGDTVAILRAIAAELGVVAAVQVAV